MMDREVKYYKDIACDGCMAREIKYYENIACDGCGAKGAFDFIGDYYCADCADGMNKEVEQKVVIPGVNVRLIFPDDDSVNDEFLDVLREQNIDCSDWDYMLIFDNANDLFRPVYSEIYENMMEPVDSYTIERLLTGCNENVFLRVLINDVEMVMVISYH